MKEMKIFLATLVYHEGCLRRASYQNALERVTISKNQKLFSKRRSDGWRKGVYCCDVYISPQNYQVLIKLQSYIFLFI